MPSALRLILGDQLTESLDIIQQADPASDLFFMAEVDQEATHVKHHGKKIAFIFSAMRHFAKSLQKSGFRVRYTTITDTNNTHTLFDEVKRIIGNRTFQRIIITEPSEYHLKHSITTWEGALGIPVEILPDTRFLCSHQDFQAWAQGKTQLRMEMFYRVMRQKTTILMQDGNPEGGKWNYDSANQAPYKGEPPLPQPLTFQPDDITHQVLQDVGSRFSGHFGALHPFNLAVTREQALQVLNDFVAHRLPFFGTYQDAMIQGEPWMFHSLLSAYINVGLLLPLEVIQAAEQAFYAGTAPLNAVEGFIRQILGWREYVRGVYWMMMPEYRQENFFNATQALPTLYWDGKTQMNCLKQCVTETLENAYAHHIQRLMVLGNFASLTQVDPHEINEWFWIVYLDAFEWVELPNVTGMALFADGGKLASKPYIASGNYIRKMSNYCTKCHYDVNLKSGPKACPFNYLYWYFLLKNQEKLSKNSRLRMPLNNLNKMEDEKKRQIKEDSLIFLKKLNNNELI
ncbi:cryptochrome/photolyase family protein [Alteromonas sp. a30]|uniref:cryptochrome/photolyase family protein n=1 Tax=Alteromonas sp. a30 TaxID=2730917 RepID=UPI00227ED63F|nr:cryptochrome/photolyase family protein [Alteromonas sp. a30]MCY7295658.1 cryptochrome/photolyase family protein [Alteromonas sp. a30]